MQSFAQILSEKASLAHLLVQPKNFMIEHMTHRNESVPSSARPGPSWAGVMTRTPPPATSVPPAAWAQRAQARYRNGAAPVACDGPAERIDGE